MMKRVFAALAGAALAGSAMAAATPVPALRNDQLTVGGKPFLMLGGELGNSSSSSRAYMAERWGALKAMHLNTVLMPVSWEAIEPEEGRFDFALVDGLVADARAHDLKIVILWFGSWKNSMSSYAPAWVKRDQRRFPRVRTADGSPVEILSPFVPASAEADARAYGALMAHLAKTDTDRTVIMVQVENEVALVPEARDRSAEADAAWRQPVPQGLAGAGKSWEEAYGGKADEAFMAWGFARYVETVAAAGKRAYPLPTYVNAALPRPGAIPGSGYPAAGPLPHLWEIWKTGAPSIDLLEPDIYFPNFVEWTRQYARPGNPLMIPEANQAGSPDATANALFAIGELDAFGFSPFSIDSMPEAGAKSLGELYGMLDSLAPLILERRGTDRMAGARPPIGFDDHADLADQQRTFGQHRLTLRFIDPWTPRDKQTPETHGALILQLGPDEFLIAGRGVTVTFAPVDGKGKTGIERIDEGRFVDGRWVAGRLLNGDQTHQGRHLRLPIEDFGIQRVKLYRYQ
jgi:beta-galactosidase GanA